jgi:predicted nuclease with TOPRIM domain
MALSDAERALVEQLATLAQRNETLAVEVGILRERTRTLEQESTHLHQRLHTTEHERDQFRARLAELALQTATEPTRQIIPILAQPTTAKRNTTSRWRRVVAIFVQLDG